MKLRRNLISALSSAILLCSCVESEPQNVTYEITLGKVPMTAVFKNGDDTTWSVWGASMIKGEDNLYHIYYSRWKKGLGWSWVVDSEIAHATSASPFGPWEFRDVVFPRRDAKYWDGLCTHNPTIRKFGDKYYLYYMGNTGDGLTVGSPMKNQLNWTHRNNQRIGVAVSSSANGPWERFDEPILDVTPDDGAADCLMTSNPSICATPDGRYLLLYKAVGKKRPLPAGGPVVHKVAFAPTPTGPFVKEDGLVFAIEGEHFPAEDPTIWHEDGKYRAIVKRMAGTQGEKRASLIHYESEDGIDWHMAKYAKVSELELTWEDGTHYDVTHLERPQIFFENGKPLLLLCAADTLDASGVLHSFNVQIPINITKHKVEQE